MRLASLLVGSSIVVGAPLAAHAQAFVDEPNSLSAGLLYTYAPSGTLEVSTGEVPNILIFAHFVTLSADYATPINGLQVEAELPLAIVKQGEGSFSHFPTAGEWDDGDVHYGPTDLKGGLRYQIKPIEQYLGLALSAGGLYPTWDYPTNGYTAPAHHLWGIYGGISVARTLDPLLSDLFVAANYTYMHRQRLDADDTTDDFNRDYSEASFQVGYFLPYDFTIAASAEMRESHGGVTFDNILMQSETVIRRHDQLLDEDYWLAGGDLGYQVTDSFDIGASFRIFVSGTNTRNQNLYAFAMNYRFF